MSYATTSRAFRLSMFVIPITLAACGATEVTATNDGPGANTDEVVYGTDNRQDVYAHPTATLRDRAAQATVALMDASTLSTSSSGTVSFNASTLQSAYDLCSTERFLSDPTAAFCSGTLIDDDLVLTAGHCITNASECASTRFVFNYYRTSATGMHAVTSADVFSCASIVTRQQATVGGREIDYAILRLDRAATPRFTPAPVRTGNAALTNNTGVAVIGCGSGVPFKIDSGGKVRDSRSGTLDYFVATTDTFGGNSGSGVYETTGYAVAGILVRGDTDYKANGSCNVVNTCTETGCQGEEITYVANAVSALCAATTSSRLCGSTPPVDPPVNPPSTATSFSYSASNTNNATVGTTNKSVSLVAGDTIEVGTCTVIGASATGDTYLMLYSGATKVAGNDDACGGQASYFSYAATAAGSFEIRAGCYANTACSGTVAWKITHASTTPTTGSGSFAFTASNTGSATTGTTNKSVALTAGQTLKVGTCTVAGASGTGDTFLRLFGATGTEAASNDDSCSGTLSYLSYTATAAGTFEIRAGCYANTACSGTVAYTVQ